MTPLAGWKGAPRPGLQGPAKKSGKKLLQGGHGPPTTTHLLTPTHPHPHTPWFFLLCQHSPPACLLLSLPGHQSPSLPLPFDGFRSPVASQAWLAASPHKPFPHRPGFLAAPCFHVTPSPIPPPPPPSPLRPWRDVTGWGGWVRVWPPPPPPCPFLSSLQPQHYAGGGGGRGPSRTYSQIWCGDRGGRGGTASTFKTHGCSVVKKLRPCQVVGWWQDSLGMHRTSRHRPHHVTHDTPDQLERCTPTRAPRVWKKIGKGVVAGGLRPNNPLPFSTLS